MNKINKDWQAEVIRRVDNEEIIAGTFTWLKSLQWLIGYLAHKGVPYKLVNLGAGVKQLTTDTDTCPFCKQKIKKEATCRK